jgi:ribosomal protein S18 acetylase RimI-like enzyme
MNRESLSRLIQTKTHERAVGSHSFGKLFYAPALVVASSAGIDFAEAVLARYIPSETQNGPSKAHDKTQPKRATSLPYNESLPVLAAHTIQLRACGMDALHALSQWAQRYYAEDHIDFDPQRFSSALAGAIQQQRGSAFWIVQAQTKVGYAIVLDGWSIEYGGLTVELDELYIAPEHRNQGCAAHVISQLKTGCAQRNAVFMGMETTPDNVGAQKLYQRLGFAATGRPVFRWMV